MYWFFSRNDKKVTNFRKKMVFIWCLCLLLRVYTGAEGSVGPPTCVGGGERGRGGVQPFLFLTKNSQIVAYSVSILMY